MKKTLFFLSYSLLCALLLTSCGGDSVTSDTDVPTTPFTDEQTAADTVIPEDQKVYYVDPLTGLADSEKDISDIRPIAVVLKNDAYGAPQFGIAKADVVYEVTVEGGMTRLLALYTDYSSVDKIGPVIDSRAPFYRIASLNDAVLIKAGTTSYAKTIQNGLNVSCIDAIMGEMAPLFERNKELIDSRGYSSSILADGSCFSSKMKSSGISVKRGESSQTVMSFYDTAQVLSTGDYCIKLTVPYSAVSAPYFEYSTLTNSYTRYQFGNVHSDADGTILKYTNVVVLFAKHLITDSTTGEMDIDISSGGDGYYAHGGRYIPIKWGYNSSDGRFIYTDENGTLLKFSPGNTFVCVASEKTRSKITFN